MPPPGTPEILPWVPVSLRKRPKLDSGNVSPACGELITQGLPGWSMLFLEPWLAAVERAETESALWLGETSSAMSECMHEWLIPTPSIDDAIDAALNASQVLSAALLVARDPNVDAARGLACTAMSNLINAVRHAKPRKSRFGT